MEKVSIILPAYNCQETIKKAIESTLEQTYKDIELIIINDGSTDSTENVCKKYIDYDKRIIYKKIENSGVSYARNTGIEQATGKYLMFIDSDDFYSKNMVEEMVRTIEKDKVDLVSCNYNKIYPDKLIKSNKDYVETEEIYNINNLYIAIDMLNNSQAFKILWNKIYITQIVKTHNIKFDTRIFRGEDYKFNVDYFRYIKSLKIINTKLYYYHIGDNGLAKKYDENEFNRRISNLNYQRDFYIERNYDLKYLNTLYILGCYASLLKMSDKSQKEKMISEIFSNQDVERALKYKNSGPILIRILRLFLKFKCKHIIIMVSNIMKKVKKER